MGAPQILQSWQPRLPALAQATSKIFLLIDLCLATEVSHLGMPIPGPQANGHYTPIEVLDGLHVSELKEETHLMKQTNS